MKEANDYLESEMLEALEQVQLAYQAYLASYERLASSCGKRGLVRPGGKGRVRALTQYAELLNSKIELALEPRGTRDRLGYILEKRKYDKRTGSIHEAIDRLRALEAALPERGRAQADSLKPKHPPMQRPQIHVESPRPEARRSAARPLPVNPDYPVIRLQVPALSTSPHRSAPPEAAGSKRSSAGAPMIRLRVPELTPASKQPPLTERRAPPGSPSPTVNKDASSGTLSGNLMLRLSSPANNRQAMRTAPASTRPLLFTPNLKSAKRGGS